MTFAWSARSKLTPLRMVWGYRHYNEPEYELRKLRRPTMRRRVLPVRAVCVIDADRMIRAIFPGNMMRNKMVPKRKAIPKAND